MPLALDDADLYYWTQQSMAALSLTTADSLEHKDFSQQSCI